MRRGTEATRWSRNAPRSTPRVAGRGRRLGLAGPLLATALALAAAGCTVGPDYERPPVPLPDAWQRDLLGEAEGARAAEFDLTRWWRAFGDPRLDALLARVLEENLDLRAAVARIDRARALRGMVTGELAPIVDGDGSYDRLRASENTGQPTFGSSSSRLWSLPGFSGSWELDLFGRVRRSVEAARADHEAAVEDARDVAVALLAETAATYFEVATLGRRLALARANADAQRSTLELTRGRFRSGLVPGLDVAQAEANLAATEARIPALAADRDRALHRLGVLAGAAPSTFDEEWAEQLALPVLPAGLTAGTPADLLRRRPDIRRAERRLAAQTARIGIATAELYPQLSFGGSFSFEAHDAADLLRKSSQAFSFGPSFRWRLLDGGIVRNGVRVEEARTREALAHYRQAVLRALEEVENALSSFAHERARHDALARAADATGRATELVRTLYEGGVTDFQNVLDSERSLVVQQDELATSTGALLIALVDVYRALGGGWQGQRSDAVDLRR